MSAENDTTVVVTYKSLASIGYPKYRVGDDGSVWRWKITKKEWKQLKACVGPRKMVLNLSNGINKNRIYAVHKLVLVAFVGPCPEGMECCHNDGNFRNNRLSNLRWDTHRSNINDMFRHNTVRKGRSVHFAKLQESEVLEIRRLYATKKCSLSQLARKYDVAIGTIHPIVQRRTWKDI